MGDPGIWCLNLMFLKSSWCRCYQLHGYSVLLWLAQSSLGRARSIYRRCGDSLFILVKGQLHLLAI